MSCVASPQLAGGPFQSSSASCVTLGEAQAYCDMNSQSSIGFGNLPESIHAAGSCNHGPAMCDVNQLVNSGGSSGPGPRTNSLLTDANLALSGDDSLRRSAIINADSYMLIPASSLSFSSGNTSLSGFPTLEGSSVVQQIGTSFTRVEAHHDQNSQEMQQQGASSATSHSLIHHPSHPQSLSQTGQILENSHPGGERTPYTNQQAIHELGDQAFMSLSQETRERLVQHNQLKEHLLQQHVMQQLHQRSGPRLDSQPQWEDSFQRQFVSPQVQLMLQQHRLLQLQQMQFFKGLHHPCSKCGYSISNIASISNKICHSIL